LLGVEDLPPELSNVRLPEPVPSGSFHDAVINLKRELVRSALHKHGGNKLRAARELDISRCYLHRLLSQLGPFDDFGPEALPSRPPIYALPDATERYRPAYRAV